MALRSSLALLSSIALAAGVSAAAATRPAPALPASPQEAPLGGVWRLNRDLTPAPARMDPGGSEEGRGGGERRPGGGRGGGGGMGGMGGGTRGGGMPGGMGGSSAPNPEQMRRSRELMRELIEPAPELVITPGDGTMTFTDHEGRVKRYATNGKKEKHQLDAGVVETAAKWDRGALVLAANAGNGLKVKKTYRVSEDGQQLVVEVQVENSRAPRSTPAFRQVYDRAEPR